MDLRALEYIINNRLELIEERVSGTRYDPNAAIGVAKLVFANKGDISKLSRAQTYYFQEFVNPLVERVPCDGIFGEDTCMGGGFIDDESLLSCYIEDDFLCQICRHDSERISAE